jgi:hypothetical protein
LNPDGRYFGAQIFLSAFCSVAVSTLFANAVTSAFFAKLLFDLLMPPFGGVFVEEE